jgi:adenylate cyclase
MGSVSNTEVEHKFLVHSDGWRDSGSGVRYRQGYLSVDAGCTVRVRVGGGAAYLTVKGPRKGVTRAEFEYPIPVADAEAMIGTLCGGRVVEKTRYRVPHEGVVWEVDEFHGANAGLVLAEVELERVGQPFTKPAWVGQEVTEDYRYTNAWLAENPGKWR